MSKTRPYLILYNLLALALWTRLTAHVVLAITTAADSPSAACTRLLRTDLDYVTAVQGLTALAEVAHAALGLVRASPFTAALQGGGRNLVLWTVVRRFFPSSTSDSLICGDGGGAYALLACLLVWGVSDVLRYVFFVVSLVRKGGKPPRWLVWLRYSAFTVLYPVGFVAEAALVYRSLVGAEEDVGLGYRAYLFLGLLSYVPASYILYTHMLSQRRRALSPRADRPKTT